MKPTQLIISALLISTSFFAKAESSDQCSLFSAGYYCRNSDNTVSPVISGHSLYGQFMHVFGSKNARWANIDGACHDNQISFQWSENGFTGHFNGVLEHNIRSKTSYIKNITATINDKEVYINDMPCRLKG